MEIYINYVEKVVLFLTECHTPVFYCDFACTVGNRAHSTLVAACIHAALKQNE